MRDIGGFLILLAILIFTLTLIGTIFPQLLKFKPFSQMRARIIGIGISIVILLILSISFIIASTLDDSQIHALEKFNLAANEKSTVDIVESYIATKSTRENFDKLIASNDKEIAKNHLETIERLKGSLSWRDYTKEQIDIYSSAGAGLAERLLINKTEEEFQCLSILFKDFPNLSKEEFIKSFSEAVREQKILKSAKHYKEAIEAGDKGSIGSPD